MSIPAIAVHGGAGNIPADLPESHQKECKRGLQDALTRGLSVMQKGGSAVDGVEEAVQSLENFELFNAGKGAVFSRGGNCQLSASMMDGTTKLIGACGNVQRVKNPVSLARLVMNESRHVLMVGRGAEQYASDNDLEFVENEYFQTEIRRAQWEKVKDQNVISMDHESGETGEKGTVGAVAVDAQGRLAAATSTGGMVNQLDGRIPDSAVGGAGTYANNESCAISCTGIGEEFIRISAAFHVHALMEYRNITLEEAVRRVVNEVLPEGSGGIISLNALGDYAMLMNTTGMYRGFLNADGREEIAIFQELSSS